MLVTVANPELIFKNLTLRGATVANLELILENQTLRGTPSKFQAQRKLGEGGFGSVFKVS